MTPDSFSLWSLCSSALVTFGPCRDISEKKRPLSNWKYHQDTKGAVTEGRSSTLFLEQRSLVVTNLRCKIRGRAIRDGFWGAGPGSNTQGRCSQSSFLFSFLQRPVAAPEWKHYAKLLINPFLFAKDELESLYPMVHARPLFCKLKICEYSALETLRRGWFRNV